MLRPYQKNACNAIVKQWNEGNRKTLLVLPTGTGKTVVFSKIAEYRAKKGDKVLVLAHRGELLEQAQDKIQHFTGLNCALEKAQETSLDSLFPITVGSVQTMMREDRLKKFPKDYFQTVIIDEAHHSVAQSYRNILEYFQDAKVLGVTATPDRSDKLNLGNYFDSLAYEYTLPQAIKDGYLCKIIAQTIPLKIDIKNVKTAAGDFKAGELGETLDPYLEEIANQMKKYCKGRKTVVFLPLISTSQRLVKILNDKGFKAAEINGNTENRSEILKDFEKGNYNVLCNAMLLTEGWDCPSVDCIICLRATKSRSLYSQIVGRGLRLYPGKENCLLLDFLWQTERHKLVRPAHIIAKSEDQAERITKKLEDGEPMDLEEAEIEVERDIVIEREKSLAMELKAMRQRKGKIIDPLQFEMSIMDEELLNYKPTFEWEKAQATEKQLNTLEKFGVHTKSVKNKGKASKLIDRLIKRMEDRMSTPKQIKYLEYLGFQNVGIWKFQEASNMINIIKQNYWKIPPEINPATYKPGAIKGAKE